jgi:hypothetical protein
MIVCKIAGGSGADKALTISHNSMAFVSPSSSTPQSAYSFPNIDFFSVKPSDSTVILLTGSNFSPIDSDVSSSVGFGNLDGVKLVVSGQSQILVTSDALLKSKSVRDIEVGIHFKADRLDDVILSLETLPFIGRIFLLKSQCFGCVNAGSDTVLKLVFSDHAVRQLPVSACSNGVYLSSLPLSTLFTYTGLLLLQVYSGSMSLEILTASITVLQSNVNILALHIYPSLSISWVSDSSIQFKLPAILGKNNSFEVIVDDQKSIAMTGLNYPPPIILQSSLQSIQVTGSANIIAYGTFFGQRSNTLAMRIGKSSCMSSTWTSDDVIVCKPSSGLSSPDFMGAVSTVGRQLSSVSKISAHELHLVTSADNSSGFSTTGSFQVLLTGSKFGSSQFSSKSRISMSSTASSVWLSDSSLKCLSVMKWKHQMEFTATFMKLSANQVFVPEMSQTIQAIRTGSCVARSGSTLISIFGSGFAIFSSSLKVKVGETGAVASIWTSDSCTFSRVPSIGLGINFKVTVTVPVWHVPASFIDSSIFEPPTTLLYGTFAFQNVSLTSSTWAIYSALNVYGRNFGFFDAAKFKSLIIEPNIECYSAVWLSGTSLSSSCQVNPPGSDVVFQLSLLGLFQEVQVLHTLNLKIFTSQF